MVPRRCNAMTRQTLHRSLAPVLVLRRILVSGPITALAADGRLKFLTFHQQSGARQALAVDARSGRKEGPQGRNGPVNPLVIRRGGTITISGLLGPLGMQRPNNSRSLLLGT